MMRMYDVDIDALAERYRAGASTQSIADEIGVSQRTVWRYLRDHGVEMRRRGCRSGYRGPHNKDRLQDVLDTMPLEYGDISALADRWGVSKQAASQFIKYHGLQP